MTQKEMLEALENGKIMCKVLYWGGRVEEISFRDKSSPNGARRTAHVVRQHVMTDNGPMVVSRFMKDNEDPAAWKAPVARMKPCVVIIDRMEQQQGNIVLNGTVEPLT